MNTTLDALKTFIRRITPHPDLWEQASKEALP